MQTLWENKNIDSREPFLLDDLNSKATRTQIEDVRIAFKAEVGKLKKCRQRIAFIHGRCSKGKKMPLDGWKAFEKYGQQPLDLSSTKFI